MSYLTTYFDPALPVRAEDTEASISRAEQERLAKLMSVAVTAQTMPRRLGQESMPEELADDKRRAKRIAHVAAQLLKTWGGTSLNGSGADAKREAAIVDWRKWYEEHRIWLVNRQRYIATWVIKTEANEKWGKSALVKLNNELNWIEHALR